MADEPQDFILDLQTLHGEARPLIVKAPDGQRYELRRRESFGPAELVLSDKVMRRLAETGNEVRDGEELTPAQDKRLRDMVHDLIRVLSPDLAKLNLCFADEFAILNWYGAQSRAATESASETPKNAESASA